MAVKFDSVNVGDVLYDCHTYRAGNTTMRVMGTWRVQILEKREKGCLISWNGNRPVFWPSRYIEKLRRTPYKPKDRK